MGEPSEAEILETAERDARRVLEAAAAEAQEILADANKKATALLMEQQSAAARVILDQRSDAKETREQEERTAESLPEPKRGESLADAQQEAEHLRETQWAMAKALVDTQREAATALQEAVYSATLDALMEGQREAAAILSEAHGRIERQRRVAGNAAAEEGGER